VNAYGSAGRFTVTVRKTTPSDRLDSDAVIAG
jgi:hypothetical protein